MASHNEFDDFFGDDEETTLTDTRADGRLYRVPITRIAPNLVNPRTDFGTQDQLIDLGKSLARRQNQPCPVVSRNAYLKLWPEHAKRIKDVDYVLVSGERRFRAATEVALPVLDCVANDDFATDRKTFMEAVVSENVDRQNFDPVEEAYAVQALVAEFGSNRAVAQHFERADGWVTQRILLTNLAREVQDLVRQKTIPLEAARTLGKLARDKDWSARDQLEWWESEQERRAAASAARTAARQARQADPALATSAAPTRPSTEAPSFTAVKQEPDAPAVVPPAVVGRSSEPADYHGVIITDASPEVAEAAPAAAPSGTVSDPRPVERLEAIPEPRTTNPGTDVVEQATAKPFPYHDGAFAGQLLVHKMDRDQLARACKVIAAHLEAHSHTAP